jgi:hypothetical protein
MALTSFGHYSKAPMKQVIKMSSFIPKFSLRSLLLVVMVSAVLTSLYVFWFVKSSEQRFLERARAEGNFLGVSDHYREQFFLRSTLVTTRKEILVGIKTERKSLEFFKMANEFIVKRNLPVFLASEKTKAFPPDLLFQIFGLPNLAKIDLRKWRLPAGLAGLKLQSQGGLAVSLQRCELTKESLAWLFAIPNLRILEVCRCNLEDDWFAEIDPASCNLVHLSLDDFLLINGRLVPGRRQRFFQFAGKLSKLRHFEVDGIETNELQELLKLPSLDTLLVASSLSDDSIRLLLSSPNAPRIVYAYQIPDCSDSRIEFIDLAKREPIFFLDEILTGKESETASSVK